MRRAFLDYAQEPTRVSGWNKTEFAPRVSETAVCDFAPSFMTRYCSSAGEISEK
jgi:hypothetical protein